MNFQERLAENGRCSYMTREGKVLAWVGVVLNEKAKAEAEWYPGVEGLAEDLVEYSNTQWVKQIDLDAALRVDSQYPGGLYEELPFVHFENPRKDTFIYVIDHGVNLTVFNSPLVDDPPMSHGTNVASKAAGRKHGLAKEATVISVKLHQDFPGEFYDALILISKNLRRRTERQHQSVVVCSCGCNDGQRDSASQHAPNNERTIYAPGLNVLCQSKHDLKSVQSTGTSIVGRGKRVRYSHDLERRHGGSSSKRYLQ
ncbi:hypothetical protein BU23DRAFT_598470 [Bimuria novae-zelandiae CBS 107.79]|uniref:Peptidase S8/S53 domain-containing protein n=1 Tax=Bimuria novae-zelandiae CBS 107.79 TaxID=1447943 RepID=A0A6A5VDJ9_9PLEO|nr:hypothetical protein BU23DRAFT_598470 [Bimuria novae-zelandiae CBS 107.79]